ncbi:unnamed protein product [Discula destructiva]
MARNQEIDRLTKTQAKEKGTRTKNQILPVAQVQKMAFHDDDDDDDDDDLSFDPLGSKPNWHIFDEKLDRLARSNDRIQKCCWSGPTRELYLDLRNVKNTDDFVAPSKSPKPPFWEQQHPESSEQHSSEQKSSEQWSFNETSSETSFEVEHTLKALRQQQEDFSHSKHEFSATNSESESTRHASDKKTQAFKPTPHTLDDGLNGNKHSHASDGQQPVNEALSPGDVTSLRTVDQLHTTDATEDEECDADDERNDWIDDLHEHSEDDEPSMSAADTEELHAMINAIQARGSVNESTTSGLQPTDSFLLDNNCRLMRDLLHHGFQPGDDLLETTALLCSRMGRSDSSRRRSAERPLTTDDSSVAADSVSNDLLHYQKLSETGPWDEPLPHHGKLDDDDVSSNYELSEDGSGPSDAATPTRRWRAKRKVKFDAEAMQAPENGPLFSWRSSKDRAVLRAAKVSQEKCKAQIDGIRRSSSIKSIGARIRKFAELQKTVGNEEADAFLKAKKSESRKGANSDGVEDHKIWRQRCSQLNRDGQRLDVRSKVSKTLVKDEPGAQSERREGRAGSRRSKLSEVLRKLSRRRKRSRKSSVSPASSHTRGSAEPTQVDPPFEQRCPQSSSSASEANHRSKRKRTSRHRAQIK